MFATMLRNTFFRRKSFSTKFLFFNTPFFQTFHYFQLREKVYVKSARYSTKNQKELYRGKTYIFFQKSRRRLHFSVFHNFYIHYGIYCYDLFNFIYFFFKKREKAAKKEIIRKIALKSVKNFSFWIFFLKNYYIQLFLI